MVIKQSNKIKKTCLPISNKQVFLRTMNKRLTVFFLLIISIIEINGQKLGLYIKDALTKETLNSAYLKLENRKTFIANSDGYMSINRYNMEKMSISMVGYKSIDTCCFNFDKTIVILLIPINKLLNEVEIKGSLDNNFYNNSIKLTSSEISSYPSLFGEKDLIKVIQTLPGVKRIIEGGSGFSVRGGGSDQNMILVDNVPIYSYNHLFGLFSIFNTDAVKDVELTKEAMSARYGGRASSVLNIKLKEGNANLWNTTASIGLLSSKIKTEGPIIKNKISSIFSIRRSYFDLLSRPLMPKNQKQFYVLGDVYGKITYNINLNNKIIFGHYNSIDSYSETLKDFQDNENYLLNRDGLGWKNKFTYINYYFSKKNNFLNFNIYNSKYTFFYNSNTDIYNNSIKENISEFKYNSQIVDKGVSLAIEKYFDKTEIYTGIGILSRMVVPKTSQINFTRNDLKPVIFETKLPQNIEANSYIEIKCKPINSFTVTGGLRGVIWMVTKPKYFIEPRFNSILDFKKLSLKISYFKANQFVHQLSNSGGGLPNDIWINANDFAKPINSNQFSLTGMKTILLKKASIYIELGGYIKKMKNVTDYNNGENILSLTETLAKNENDFSGILSTGDGYSHGIELLLRGKFSKMDILTSYTFSKTYYYFNKINFGQKYFPNFDRRHDFSVNFSFKITKKLNLSNSIVYGSASPVTLPEGIVPVISFDTRNKNYYGYNSEYLYVNYRNNYRVQAYFRNDIAVSLKKVKHERVRVWEFSVFNLTRNKNPFYYTANFKYNSKTKERTWTPQKKMFLTIVPSISYNINF